MIKLDPKNFDSVTIYLDQSKHNEAVFYYLWSEKNIANLKKRLGAIKEKRIVIINLDIKIDTIHEIIYLPENHWRQKRKEFAEYFYPFKESLKQVAITGTNGKTTSCFLGMQLCHHFGFSALYIGTLGIYLNNKKVEDYYLTTPGLLDYRKFVHKYQNQIDYVWVEASSHGLEQERLEGIEFDAVGWTSFSQDHMDYHDSMKSYFESKKKIFKQLKLAKKDNAFLGEKISGLEDFKVATPAIISKENPEQRFIQINHNHKNFSLVLSLFSKLNPGLDTDKVKSLTTFVPGRFEIFNNSFVVDYAHTPDALKRLLIECKKLWPDRNIMTIIGCGGDRDRTKRKLMSSVACLNSDHCIFTEDNPRSESIDQIIGDMTSELNMENYEVIKSRKKAINKAVSLYQENKKKLIVIAGKGEENFIIREKSKEQHNDMEYLKSLI